MQETATAGPTLPRMFELGKMYNVTFKEVQETLDKFVALDPDTVGEVSKEVFETAVRRQCRMEEDEPLPQHLLRQGSFPEAAARGLDFEEYLDWSLKHAYLEELLVDPQEQSLRRIARELGCHYLEVDVVKEQFQSLDTDKNGVLDKDEFDRAIQELEPQMTKDRRARLWQEVDSNNDGSISLEEFVTWFFKVHKPLCGGQAT